MTVKQIGLEIFSEGARRRAVGDELRKTVPCSRSRDGESSVSDCTSSRNRNCLIIAHGHSQSLVQSGTVTDTEVTVIFS